MAVRYIGLLDKIKKPSTYLTLGPIGAGLAGASYLASRYAEYLKNKEKWNNQTQKTNLDNFAKKYSQIASKNQTKLQSHPTININTPQVNTQKPQMQRRGMQQLAKPTINTMQAPRTTQITQTTQPQTQTTQIKQESIIDKFKKLLDYPKQLISKKEEIRKQYEPTIQSLIEQAGKIQNERDRLISEIENNPYLSQATIRGRAAKAYDLYNKQISNILSQADMYRQLLNEKLQDVETNISNEQNLYTKYLGLLADKEAADNQYNLELMKALSKGSSTANTAAYASYTEDPQVQAWVKTILSKRAKLSDVPKSLKTQVAMALGNLKPADDPKVKQKAKDAELTIKTIEDALNKINTFSSGIFGKVGQYIPSTDAYELARLYDTLKSQLGFGALQAMRDASPTGGAVGQLSDFELKLLASKIAALDIGLEPEAQRRNLLTIKRFLQDYLNDIGYSNNNNEEYEAILDAIFND